ncbi:MAG: NADPH-dependent FMN reductase, partial [Moritella sp.]|nr:NADPH-dependent FMN reductase [Moritella sp.]
GSMGGTSVLATAVQSAPNFSGVVKANLAIPSFYDNFDSENKILKHAELNEQLKDAVSHLDHFK